MVPDNVRIPGVKVVKSGIFQTRRDIQSLGIIDFHRMNGCFHNDIVEAVESISSWLIGNVHYQVFEVSMGSIPDQPGWKEWKHAGNHPKLGREYYNWFMANERGTIEFSDEPDFNGILQLGDVRAFFFGDIGRVSASCFSICIKQLSANDVWISVKDSFTQIVLEPLVDMHALLGLGV